jgi:hypothetical protein
MRRTQWAVFTSMNPRPSAWRALYEPPAADVVTRRDAESRPVEERNGEETSAPALRTARFE